MAWVTSVMHMHPGNRRFDVAIVTGPIESSPAGGRSLLSRLNHDAMRGLFGTSLLEIQISPRRRVGFDAVRCALTGAVDGLDKDTISRTIAILRKAEIRKVLIDGSNYGMLAAAIKKNIPDIEIIVFFHNCEARFFFGLFRQRPSIRTFGVLLANYIAERSAVRRSDKRICLNDRDSELLRRIYGYSATHFSPMAMRDRYTPNTPYQFQVPSKPYALFVGSAFYANIQGIRWYANHVARQTSMPVYVIGNGMEHWRGELERNGNVSVVGAVNDVAPWYLGASIVIAPIFDGSGMKTKIAEALMFGKRVVGTPEAFVGYEQFMELIGISCETAPDFIAAIESEASTATTEIHSNLRNIYQSTYSFDAAKERLSAILKQ